MKPSMKLLSIIVTLIAILFAGNAAAGWEYWDVDAVAGTTRLGCESAGDRVSFDGIDFRPGNDGQTTFDTFRIYARIDGGIEKIRLATLDCAMPELEELERIERSAAESLAFLNASLGGDVRRQLASEIIAAIAHHAAPAATNMLVDLAAKEERKYWSPAIFWLPVRRGEQGVVHVENIIRNSESSDAMRKHAVFPYALGAGEAAVALLKQVIENDPSGKVRAHALFALAQTGAAGLEPFMLGIAGSNDSKRVRQQALFALSILNTKAAVDALIGFASDPGNGALRREALFWLTNSDLPSAGDALVDILED